MVLDKAEAACLHEVEADLFPDVGAVDKEVVAMDDHIAERSGSLFSGEFLTEVLWAKRRGGNGVLAALQGEEDGKPYLFDLVRGRHGLREERGGPARGQRGRSVLVRVF